ncbi:Uma2 family endonuclease [Streptomyces sp. NPDC090025]|uniref:Uma2 family endonuclease n=1 Tax=Streptomyces sp. NPDC090025 TaxID=3365922 RepID=UPI0038328A40
MGETVSAERTTGSEHECARHWPRPPQGGWTVDDLFTLPALPAHTELLDGSLVFVSPRRRSHDILVFLLRMGLRSSVPPQLRVDGRMTVIIDRRNCPEPDLLVVHKEAVRGLAQTSYPVGDVVLAVEVVSPDSESRDRDTKPHKYAAAGIDHFWLVEMDSDSSAVVRVYERDPVTKTYTSTGVHRDRLKLSVPFPIDIDLSGIDEL